MEEPATAAQLKLCRNPGGPVLVCPACKGALADGTGGFRCSLCDRRFPVISGIPDFRLKPDRYIGIEADRRKGLRILQQCRNRSFAEAVKAYYSITPDVPLPLAERYQAHHLAGEQIGEAVLNELMRLGGGGISDNACILDLGCGSGGFLAAASRGLPAAIGVDVAFRWLIIARLRLQEAGLDVPLICANAEHLPFEEGIFGAVVATDLLEHVVDAGSVLQECRRVADVKGICFFMTNNRWSLLCEPHVRVWGVGFLPRALQQPYVRLVRNRNYDKVKLLSALELSRLARRAGFSSFAAGPAPVAAGHLGRSAGLIAGLYQRIRLVPGMRQILTAIGPRLQLAGRT